MAERIHRAMGKRIVLYHEQHAGVPTRCFGDTGYFVKSVKEIE